MVVVMKGSPNSSPITPAGGGRRRYLPDAADAQHCVTFISPARPSVNTVLEEYIEHEKQFQEKEAVRAAILEEEAYQLRLKKERQKQEAKEWKERQRAWEHKIATERRSEEEARRKARSAHERRFAHEPGHGPTRWLWPTAREHPRAWIANADIPLKPEDQKESIAWQASPAARVRVDKSVRQTPRV